VRAIGGTQFALPGADTRCSLGRKNLRGKDDMSSHRAKPTQEGRYANYFEVGHNGNEILIDFGQMFNEGEKVQFHSRIITSPWHAKALLALLEESIGQYEFRFGDILDEL
jgi:hypothetical protein